MSKEKLINQLKNAYKQLEEEFKNKGRPNTIEDNNVDYDNCNIYAMRQKIFDLEAKLAEFEDFMEEQGFESLGELESVLYQLNVEASKTKELEQENQALKERWEKLKEWLIDRRDENGSKYFDNEMIEDDDILDKMKELEKE